MTLAELQDLQRAYDDLLIEYEELKKQLVEAEVAYQDLCSNFTLLSEEWQEMKASTNT